MADMGHLIGRILIAFLFLAGAVQKVSDPSAVIEMIQGIGLPGWLVWPVAFFNLLVAIGLALGPRIQLWAIAAAAYCLFTSYFHFQLRGDPWQVTIMVKNWAIAGGLLVLASQPPRRFFLWR